MLHRLLLQQFELMQKASQELLLPSYCRWNCNCCKRVLPADLDLFVV